MQHSHSRHQKTTSNLRKQPRKTTSNLRNTLKVRLSVSNEWPLEGTTCMYMYINLHVCMIKFSGASPTVLAFCKFLKIVDDFTVLDNAFRIHKTLFLKHKTHEIIVLFSLLFTKTILWLYENNYYVEDTFMCIVCLYRWKAKKKKIKLHMYKMNCKCF